MKNLYVVETISMFRVRYVVEAKDPEHATDEVVMMMGDESFKEFSQKHIDEPITDVRQISEEEYLTLFNTDNSYLSSWNDDEKKKFINKVYYKEG
jgi:hypothetical protein